MDGKPREITVITGLLAAQMALRGADYATGNPRSGTGAFEIPDPTPPVVWGVTCILVALVVAVGLVAKLPRVVRDGAVVAMAVYVVFAVMVFDDAIRDGLDDWRFCTSYLATAGVWGVLAWTHTMHMAVMRSREERDADGRADRTARDD